MRHWASRRLERLHFDSAGANPRNVMIVPIFAERLMNVSHPLAAYRTCETIRWSSVPRPGPFCALLPSTRWASSRGPGSGGAGVCDLYAVAAGLVDVEEKRLLHGVFVRAGFDEDAVFQKNVGGAQNVLAGIDGV